MANYKDLEVNREVSVDLAEKIVTLFSENNVTILQAKQSLLRAEKLLGSVTIQSSKKK